MTSFLDVVRVLLLSLLISAVVAQECPVPFVRLEWRQFTPTQRAAWIEAVNCLASLPHDPNLTPSVPANESLIPPVNTSSSYYDDYVYLHMDLNVKTHFTGMFLPWHRYYVHNLEIILVNKCGYKGTTPYWDWTIDAHDVYNSPFFNLSSSGIGGWGDPADDYQIHTGGFKDVVRAYPNPHHIRRNFSVMPFTNPDFVFPFQEDLSVPADLMINTTMTKENVEYLVNNFEGDFIGFQTYLESIFGTHFGTHGIVGGDLSGLCSNGAVPPDCYPGAKWASNDPLFFMLHAMIDKVWFDWQNKSPKNRYAFGGGSVQALDSFADFTEFPTGRPPFVNFDTLIPGDGLWENNVTVWDVMDPAGEFLCYIYN